MSIYVGIQGYKDSLTNIVTNGLLTSNITGWTSNTYFNYSYDNCTQLTVKTAQSGTNLRPTYQSISISGSTAATNQILYAQATVKGSSSNSSSSWPIVYFRRYLNGGSSASQVYLQPYENTLNDNQWHTISLRVSTYVSSSEYYNYDRICFSIKPPLVLNNTCYYKNIILVNLTEKFGRGNEPTKEWCDSNIYMDSNGDVGYNISGSVAIKMNRLFVGVNNIARRIKKAYIGINNVARKFFGPIIKYKGLATSLTTPVDSLAGASTDDYAIFAGGVRTYVRGDSTYYEYKDDVYAYNNSLVLNKPSVLTSSRSNLTGISFNNYALFGGGNTGSGLYPIQTTVDVYNNNLQKLNNLDFSTRRKNLSGGSILNYAIFAGGYQVNIVATYLKSMEIFNSSLVLQSSSLELSNTKENLACASSDSYILFGGGEAGTNSSYIRSSVNAYDNSLVSLSCSDLSAARYSLSGCFCNGKYLFAGGLTSATYSSDAIDVYDSSLIKTNSINLSISRSSLSCNTIDDYAIFAGGVHRESSNNYNYTDTIDVFDEKLIAVNIDFSLSVGRNLLASAIVGNYALFAGGYTNTYSSSDNNVSSSNVDIIESYY